MRSGGSRWLWLWALLPVGAAWADDPLGPGPAGPDVAPPLLDASKPLRDGHVWVRVGPRGPARMSDLAVHPIDPAIVAAAGIMGDVWLSLDGGSSWVQVMDPIPVSLGVGSSDEEIRQQVEAHFQDILQLDDGPDVDDPDYLVNPDVIEESQDEFDRMIDAAFQAADQVRADLQVQPGYLLDAAVAHAQADVLAGRLDAARPRVWFSEDGWLFLGRADGLHLSKDLATSWREVLDVPATALAFLASRGLWVAGTRDGVRFSTDAVAWIDADDNTDGRHVYDLAPALEGMYAATSEGLMFAADAQRWAPVGGYDEPLLSVLPDPDWEGGLWMSTEQTVLRSDDQGRAPRAPTGAPIPGVVSMERLGPGHLLVAGSDGPWESLDGGVTWIPVARGLSDPDTRDVEVAGSVVLLASSEGIFALRPWSGVTLDLPSEQAVDDVWIDVELLLQAATERRGLTERAMGAAVRGLYSAMPEIRVEARYNPDDALSYRDSSGTASATSGLFSATARLVWTPDGRKQSGGINIVVQDDDIMIDDGRDRALLAARVNRSGTAYRQLLINQLMGLYYARSLLVQQSPRLRSDSLAVRVEHELKIREIESRIDAYCDGAVSRWYASQSLETP